LDPAIRHTVVHHSSTSTYIPNFIQIEETFCGRTDGRTGTFSPSNIIRLTFGSRPKKERRHREKRGSKMVVLLLHIGKFCFLMPVFNYLYFRNRPMNFVKICIICTNQMVIKVATSVINSDKLSHSYDDLYLVWDIGY